MLQIRYYTFVKARPSGSSYKHIDIGDALYPHPVILNILNAYFFVLID